MDNSTQTPPPVAPTAVPESPKRSNLKKLLLIALPILVVLILVGYIFRSLLLPKNQENSSLVKQNETVQAVPDFNPKSGVLATLVKESTPPAALYYHDCVVSPNGYHVACAKYSGNLSDLKAATDTLVVDGKEGEVFRGIDDGIRVIQYTADNKLAYIAARNGRKVVVIDGKEDPPYEMAGGLAFSSDGKHYAYCAGTGIIPHGIGIPDYKTISMIVDGKELKSFENADSLTGDNCLPVFSPDGTQVAYAISSKDKSQLYLNDKEISSSTDSKFSKPLFSGDGTKLYFVVYKRVNGDDKGVPTLTDLSGKVIKSINSTLPAYASYLAIDRTGEKLVFIGSNGFTVQALYLNEEKIAESSSIWNQAISPDGTKLIYTPLTTGGSVMVGDDSTSPVARVILNGQEIDNYKTFFTRVSPVVFSQNGKYIAYLSDTLAAGSRLNIDPTLSKLVVIKDQKVCKIPFNGIPFSNVAGGTTASLASPIFSPDGDHIGFAYKLGQELIWKVGKIDMDSCSI